MVRSTGTDDERSRTLFRSRLMSILDLLLFCPAAAARQNNGLSRAMDFADRFSTLNCYCFSWEDPTGPGPPHYRSGSYLGIGYYNREFELQYIRTTWEVRNLYGRLLRHTWNWDLRPQLGKRC
ncbi:hypothetical protein MMC22_005118 [Lobaria immixta]|nr:hypothetical protein [Lobaria immixta]